MRGPDCGLDGFALSVNDKGRRGVVVGVDCLQVTALISFHLDLLNFELAMTQAEVLTRILHVEISSFHVGVQVLFEGFE